MNVTPEVRHPQTSLHPLRDGRWLAGLVILFGIAAWGYQKVMFPEPQPPEADSMREQMIRDAISPQVPGATEEAPEDKPPSEASPVIVDE